MDITEVKEHKVYFEGLKRMNPGSYRAVRFRGKVISIVVNKERSELALHSLQDGILNFRIDSDSRLIIDGREINLQTLKPKVF